jgi:hypothetical protein
MERSRVHHLLAASVMVAALCATHPGTAHGQPVTVAKQEYTIGTGSFGYDFVFLCDFHIAEGKKFVDGMDDFGTPGYDDADNDPLEMTRAVEADMACVDYINANLVGQPGYDIRFVVLGGDFTTSSERSEWQRARAVLDGLSDGPFVVPILGNHDGWPYVGHGLSFYPPFPGYYREQPEAEVVVGQYFVDAYRGIYDTLRCIQPAANWEQSEWLLTPTEKTCHRWPSYYNNFAFSVQGCRFIVADFNTRKDPPPSERPGLRGEPDVYSEQPYHWSLDWLRDQVAAVRPGERIICLGHQPYDQEYTNFQMDELRIIADAGLLNNRPVATSIGGHIHPFGDKPGRQLFGKDTAWDYYRPNAAKDGKVYVFRIRDSVQLQVTHAHSQLAAGAAVVFDGVCSFEGEGNAPAQFCWTFGDGSPPETTGASTSHQFAGVVPDTVYKVSLTVTTASGRRIWACDTVRVLGTGRRAGPGRELGAATSGMSISPNPLAGGSATVRYSLGKAGPATLSIYDVAGRAVLTRTMSAGRTGTARLELRELNPGVYLVKISTANFSTTRKLILQQ